MSFSSNRQNKSQDFRDELTAHSANIKLNVVPWPEWGDAMTFRRPPGGDRRLVSEHDDATIWHKRRHQEAEF